MKSALLKQMVYMAALLTFSSLAFLLFFVLWNGMPHLSPQLFALKYTSQNVSLLPSFLTTLLVVGLSLLIASPVGIGTAIYLSEYADSKSRFVQIIRMATDTLAAVPSIVYGLFGMLFFVTFLKWQYSVLSGVGTSVIMILPLIIRSSEEAFHSTGKSLREASLALGAGKTRTIFSVLLPAAAPGILAGIILASGRVIGETAALMYTLGTSTHFPKNLMSSGRTLALHMYVLSSEGLHIQEAYATAVMLVLMVIFINAFASWMSRKLVERGSK